MRACLRMQDLTFRERIVLAELAGYDGPNGSYPSIVPTGGRFGHVAIRGE